MPVKETIDNHGHKQFSLYYPMTTEMMMEMIEIGDFDENIKDVKKLLFEHMSNDINEVLRNALPHMFSEDEEK